MTSNIGELSIVLLGLIAVSFMGWDIPILAIQILAIDLIAEILPLTALTFDSASEGMMKAPPRKANEHILNKGSIRDIVLFGFLMGGLAFLNFGWFLLRNGIGGSFNNVDPLLYQKATTISYVTIVACQFVNILSRRYDTITIFNRNLWSNRYMIMSILLSILLVSAAVYLPFINRFLKFRPLNGTDWLTVAAGGAVYLIAHEAAKIIKRMRKTKK